MNTLRQMLFTNWNFMRWLRLLAGIYLTYEAVANQNAMLVFFSAFFLIQALTNTGCNGSSSCATPTKKYTAPHNGPKQ